MCKIKLLATLLCLMLIGVATTALAMTAEEKLGQRLYFDKSLSLNENQSCASCHLPSTGFVDPMNVQNPYNSVVSLGSDVSLNGGRNAPTASYAAFIPVFHWDDVEGLYVGGQFWNGRADTLKDQAKGPFRNPMEMAMDEAKVIAAIANPQNKNYKIYKNLFDSVYGIDLTAPNLDVPRAYDKVAEAIAVFEQTTRFMKFTSKYDAYLADEAQLTLQEQAGLILYNDKAQCFLCHPSAATVNSDGTIVPPLFTDFTYDNLGVPKSDNLLIALNDPDLGLGNGENKLVPETALNDEKGKFRVSSLRNIAKTPPYAHNGYFATLEEIVNFYNTRDVDDSYWDADEFSPEVDKNVNEIELGALGLSPQEEADLVAFLKTLSDGYCNRRPANFVLPPITPLTP